MYKIAVFQDDMGVGGIQKSLVNLLRNLDYSKFAVDLYIFQEGSFWSFEFPDSLNVFNIEPLPSKCKYMPFERVMKNYTLDLPDRGEYDLAVDFNSYQPSCALGALQVPAKKHVMWIHNNVVVKHGEEWKYRVLWHFFKGKFRYFDDFVPCSAALEQPFRELSGIKKGTFPVIENYIDVKDITEKAAATPEDFTPDSECFKLVAVGKLCHQKGYDIMLNVLSKALKSRDDLQLYLLGDGPDREKLQAMAEGLGISGHVTFMGRKENPFCYMKLMDAYISTSRYEGQPLNTMEAMAIGLPLYCSKNLEQYTRGLKGYEDLAEALVNAKKEPKKPDGLEEYNSRILSRIEALCSG